MSKLEKCKSCGAEIDKKAKICPACGAKHKKHKVLGIALVILGIYLIAVALGATEEPQQPDGTAQIPDSPSQDISVDVSESSPSEDISPVEEEEEESVWHKAGMYKVGSDIPAGEYLIQASGSCYMQVSTDSSGSLNSIATNDNFSDWRYITLLDEQYLTVRNGSFASIDDIDPITSSTGSYAAGMYKVGRDLEAGEYKIEAIGNCYLEVTEDSTGSLYSIVNNDNIKTGENRYVTVLDGQYIEFSNAVMAPVD